jgi:Flp pilus assembly protein TadG
MGRRCADMRTWGALPTARRGSESGQDAVEFALIISILVLILMAIFDLGRATYYISALHNAAREGARYASVFPDDVVGIEAVVDTMAVAMPPDEVMVSVLYPDAETVTVHVEYDMTLVTTFFGTSFTIGSQSTVSIEQ